MNEDRCAVAVAGLNHTYQSGHKNRQALKDLTLAVEPGEIFGLLGPNGGGKTTLFKILSTAFPIQSGSARVFGADLQQNAADVRRMIGVVFQNPSLDKKLTLLENIRTQGRLYGISGANFDSHCAPLLQKLSLTDRADDLVEQLSGGLQRRVEIAKGLLHKPRLLLMDEPSTGLDPGARRELWELINELKKDGATILVTTHLMEEGDRCDRIGILHHGQLVALGTPNELKKKIGGDMVIVQTDGPAALAEKIRGTFNVKATVLDNTVRIEMPEGHKFIPKLIESFPGEIKAASVGKPTLEDVFVHVTGHGFGTGHE